MNHSLVHRLLIGLSLVGVSVAPACGGDDGAECGMGTVEVDGVCLPAAEVCADGTVYQPETRSCAAQCAEGTIRQGAMCVPALSCAEGTRQVENSCVPDGTVSCGGNTILDTESGECVPDPDAICEGDLVYVVETRSCVDPDSLLEDMADVRELMEPNDPAFNEAAMAQPVDISDGTGSFWGCIEPEDFNDDGDINQDRDFFSVEVDGPTLVEFSMVGFDGLSPSILAVGDDEQGGTWLRTVYSLATSRPRQQIFFPRAGNYILIVQEASALLAQLLDFPLPIGGPGRCYFGQMEVQELPTPTPITAMTPARGTYGDPVFYSYTTAAEGEFVGGSLYDINEMGERANNGLHESAVTILSGEPPRLRGTAMESGGLASTGAAVPAMGTDVWVVAERVINFSTVDVQYELALGIRSSSPVPNGTTTITHDEAGVVVGAPLVNNALFTFEATAGQVGRLEFDGAPNDDFDVRVIAPDGTAVFAGGGLCRAELFTFPGFGTFRFEGCASASSLFEFVETGTYTIAIYNYDGDDGEDYDVTLSMRLSDTTELTRGMSQAGELGDDTPAYFRHDARTADWIRVALTDPMNVTDFATNLYASEGTFGELPRLGATVSTAEFERIYLAEGPRLVLEVSDSAGNDGDETFDITISNVEFVDLGTVTSMMPIERTGLALPAEGFARFILRADTPGETVELVASAGAPIDLALQSRNRSFGVDSVIDEEGEGEPETSSLVVGDDGLLLIFTVSDESDTGGMFDLNITSTPPPYTFTMGDVPFASVCPAAGGGGVVHPAFDDDGFEDDDDGLTAAIAFPAGFNFAFFGELKTDFVISTNGWLSFDTTVSDSCWSTTFEAECRTMGDVIAPFWVDLDEVTICTASVGERFIVEWDGVTWSNGDAAQVQAILHAPSGRIDFVYGPAHRAPRGSGIIGVRNADASVQIGPTPTTVPAESSYTFTPAM